MEHLRGAVGILVELVDRGALGTQAALAVRAALVALDVHDLAVDGMDQGGAADGAIGADARSSLCRLYSELLCSSRRRRQAGAESDEGTQCSPWGYPGGGCPQKIAAG